MSISDLIRLAQNRLATLNSARATADRDGDADRVAALEAEIVKTEETIATLRRVS
jgi:hypothetical protein